MATLKAKDLMVDRTLSVLNARKIRATYGAVGELLGIPAIGVGRKLGEQRPEASWVVGAKHGKPSGYSADNCHPELYSNPLVINSGTQLKALVDEFGDLAGNVAPKEAITPRYASTAEQPLRWPAISARPLAALEPEAGECLLMGIDLAWLSDANGSGLAIGTLNGRQLYLEQLYANVIGFDRVFEIVAAQQGLRGVAIDAPLIINNAASSRPCEKALSKVYSRQWAGCHPSNLARYPDASSVRLGEVLERKGFKHLGKPGEHSWQVECYPHPAIIELFGLEKRLAYKKGTAQNKKDGQQALVRYIRKLADSHELNLCISPSCEQFFDEDRIQCLKGQAIKDNEDGLDAALCLYIAGLYAIGSPMRCFGGLDDGYIVVPQNRQIP